MDPIPLLAASIVSLLAPYLAMAGDESADETRKAVAGRIGELFQELKTRFENQPKARQALAALAANPSDEDAQADLRTQLRKQMTGDPNLMDTLRKRLDEIKQDKESVSFLQQVYGGNAGGVFNVGGPFGDSTTDAPPPSPINKL